MQIEKTLGKLKFELKLSRFQVAAIAAWMFFLLIVPIGVDQLLKSQEPVSTSAQTSQSDTNISSENSEASIFTYTVELSDQKELISTLTLVFGSISAIVAVGTVIFFIKESMKKEPSVFDS